MERKKLSCMILSTADEDVAADEGLEERSGHATESADQPQHVEADTQDHFAEEVHVEVEPLAEGDQAVVAATAAKSADPPAHRVHKRKGRRDDPVEGVVPPFLQVRGCSTFVDRQPYR